MKERVQRSGNIAQRALSERMDTMKKNIKYMMRVLLGMVLGWALVTVTRAQQPTPSPKKFVDAKTPVTASPGGTGSDGQVVGDYTIISSMEFGYRGLRVDGDLNKFQSDLNYKAGPRVFDTTFLMRAKEGTKGTFVDSVSVNTTGWGADPYGNLRVSVEKSSLYRFDGTYRRFKYFNFLDNLANPATATVAANKVTGRHGYDVRQEVGDFDLTILPKNEKIRFTVGYSPERYNGPTYTTYHIGGGEFMLLSNSRSQSNDYRVGADGKVGPIDFSVLQGFRRFKDDSLIDMNGNNFSYLPGASNVANLTSFKRNEPVRGSVDYTRVSLHTFLAKKLDITGRIVYSSATTNFLYTEAITGFNFNSRITGAQGVPNILNLASYNQTGNAKRPNTLGDFGATYLATDKLRISETFRVETFQINGGEFYRAAFLLSKPNGVAAAPIIVGGNPNFNAVTKYRKIQNTVEGDYQFNDRYSMHLGYRYGNRRVELSENGFLLSSNVPTAIAPSTETEQNHTNAFFGGFKARPVKTWTVYFDAERGTADNVFTRLGNYNYTNFRARSRYAPNRKVSLSFALITRNNSNPSEIGGVSLNDFGVNIKSRIFTSSVEVTPNSKLSFSGGYSYNWVNSDAVVNYFYNTVNFPAGHSRYYMRNNFIHFDAVAQLLPRVTLYAAYRINKDTGQGNILSAPTMGLLVTSFPMSFQSPEARLAIRLNNRLDWNLGYQYYNYHETLIANPLRPQNYHAHLPYMSLRVYIGRSKD
jgi:hypothetical protein